VLTTLPPKDVDMQDAVLFVLVGSQKDAVKGSSLLRAPRDEVELRDGAEDLLEGCVLETAEDSALAQELLQRGPADAQGQDASEDEEREGAGEEKRESQDAPGKVLKQVQCYWLLHGRDCPNEAIKNNVKRV